MFLFCFIKNKTKNPQNAVILEFVSFKESQKKKLYKKVLKNIMQHNFSNICIALNWYINLVIMWHRRLELWWLKIQLCHHRNK